MKEKIGNTKQEQDQMEALNKLQSILNDELSGLDINITSDFLEIIKGKIENNSKSHQDINEDFILTDEVSHQSQVDFFINHAIKFEDQNKDIVFLMDNYHYVQYYGVEYLIRISDYQDKQHVYEYIVENYSEEKLVNQTG